MKVLGIDPGLATIGYGLIESDSGGFTFLEYGIIQTAAHEIFSERLGTIAREFRKLLERTKPETVAFEELFFFANRSSAMKVAHARGVLLLVAQEQHLPIREVKPLEVKRALSSFGRAQKAQMQKTVQKLLKLEKPPRPDDAADALAIAMTASLTK